MSPQYAPQPSIDLDSDVAVTSAQFMLSPDIPPAERKHFEKFYLMFSKIMALGNIDRTDIFPILIAFDEICILLEMGLYDDARKIMAKELMKIQLSRSVGGFHTLFGASGISRTEHIERVMSRQKRKSLTGKITGMFRREKNEPMEVGMVSER